MLNEIVQKFSLLTRREQGLVVATLCVVLVSSWYEFFYDPLQTERATLQQQRTDIDTQLATQQQRAGQLQQSPANPDTVAKKNQLLALKNQYDVLQKQIHLLDKKFVPAALMAQVLSDLLKQNNQLTLIKLDTLPVKRQKLLYQHGLELRFAGSYLATLTYLKALEAMPWNFIWDSIDYEVKDYPNAEITLRVFTFSLEKSWFDV